MRAKSYAPAVCLLGILLLSLGQVGCGALMNLSTLSGTWVGYEGLVDGEPEPAGDTSGVAGTILVLLRDGSGMSIDPEEPETHNWVNWLEVGDILKLTTESGTSELRIGRDGDTLTLSHADGPHILSTKWQLHVGPDVLIGSWALVSVVDDNGGDAPSPPAQLRYEFDSAGQLAVFSGSQGLGTAEYSTDGPVLTIGPTSSPTQVMVFTVVGSTLYLFQDVPASPEDQLLVWKFDRR